MSGHSKWNSIKHQKGAADKKKGKLFSIFSKKISIAARTGGKDPEKNLTLKTVLEKARQANMPRDTVERAIKRGTGELPGQGPIEQMVYEAYGPSGVQIVVTAMSDNRNRTTATVKHVLSKHGGTLGAQGSVMWNFTRIEDRYESKTTQSLDGAAVSSLEAIIEELEADEDVEEIYTNFAAV